MKLKKHRRSVLLFVNILILLTVFQFHIEAQSHTSLRRPISPSSPMWLIHIDTWNNADPQKIINLIPADIRPYVVMNISLSVSHDVSTGAWNKVEYGYETAKSWLRTCAENQVWAMIQPASGGPCHFSETDLTVYKEFYENYPNFIGFNYAEQFWGFDDASDVRSVSWTGRIAHFVDLINMADTYGGYLCVSWCGAYYGASINPIAMLKRNTAFASILQTKTDHFILCEKYTSKYGFYDIESTCLGAYLSGYTGQYGIRSDQTGWSGGENATGDVNATFPVPAGAAPIIEHAMLTGETVFDGPELIWQQCVQGLSNGTTSDGYTTRRWGKYPQFNNISIDIFRKILDGTIRIMTRKEVIDRTKLVITNDVSSGADTSKYSTPMSLFDGLYKMNGSGQLLNNRTWFKKTGRYPAIPIVYALNGTDANSFSVKVDKSAYATRWSTTTAKVNEFNSLFPEEYTGDLYVGRNENGWVTYNPYKPKGDTTASASIPFKYNTCDHLELTYSRYTVGIIKEFSDKLTFYLTNYDNTNTSLKTDTIKIYGSTSEPTYSYTDRASHTASTITKSWSGGVHTLAVTHNGPLDITINCSGTATSRLTSYQTATLTTPSTPIVYTGPCQYEAENFDYKNIAGNVTQGYNTGIANYTAMGYLQFGTNAAASIKDTVTVQRTGTYILATKYTATGGNVTTIDLYVNGVKVATPTFTATTSTSTWGFNNQSITLNAGSNIIEFRANATSAYTIYFDNIILTSPSINTLTGSITSFFYAEGSGPSTSQSFTISGSLLTDNVVITAPSNYEVSLNPTSGYASSLTLVQSSGTIALTTVYVRMAAGLALNTYSGNLSITSTGTLSKSVYLSGKVNLRSAVAVSVTTLSDINYVNGAGPSAIQSFDVSGSSLVGNVILTAPSNFEISLSSTTGYLSSLTLTHSNGTIALTKVYVRLKAGLAVNSYSGNISITSTDASSQTVSLSGSVTPSTGVKVLSESSATIILKEYYTITGQRLYNTSNLKGLYIIRNYMSDGTITVSKIWKD